MITGLTPYSSAADLRAAAEARRTPSASAHDDQRRGQDEAGAGDEQARPAAPRRWPMWIASSVEFGPGIRLVAPSRSRNSSRVSQRRRRTTSSSIIAMCAAGPPNAVEPEPQEQRGELAQQRRRA